MSQNSYSGNLDTTLDNSLNQGKDFSAQISKMLSEKLDKAVATTQQALDTSARAHREGTQKLAEFDEKMSKVGGESAALIKEVSDLKSAQEEILKTQKELETLASRPGSPSKPMTSEAQSKYYDGLSMYFRKRHAVNFSDVEAATMQAVTPMLKGRTASEAERVCKDLIEGSNPDGGYYVFPPQRLADEVTRIFPTSPMRSVARIVTANIDRFEMVINDQLATSGWTGEIEARPATDTPQIGLLTIDIQEQYAFPQESQRFMDDAIIDPVSWIMNKIDQVFTLTENTAFMSGTGVKMPRGVLDYPTWQGAATTIGDDSNYERGALEHIVTAGGAIDYDDMINLTYALRGDWRAQSPVYMMHNNTWIDILKIKSTTDFPLISPMGMLKDGTSEVLLGRPVVMAEDMPQVAAGSGTQLIIYGAFNPGYTIGDRLGTRVLRDPFTNKPFVGFYATKRVGGALTNYQSLKVLELV